MAPNSPANKEEGRTNGATGEEEGDDDDDDDFSEKKRSKMSEGEEAEDVVKLPAFRPLQRDPEGREVSVRVPPTQTARAATDEKLAFSMEEVALADIVQCSYIVVRKGKECCQLVFVFDIALNPQVWHI